MARSNGKPKGLPRLVPGGQARPRARREVDLPGLGASVVIEAPSVGAWQTIDRLNLDDTDRSIALAALALVEPVMSEEEFAEAIKEWPVTDWVILDRALGDLMEITEEALRDAQREFRASNE